MNGLRTVDEVPFLSKLVDCIMKECYYRYIKMQLFYLSFLSLLL